MKDQTLLNVFQKACRECFTSDHEEKRRTIKQRFAQRLYQAIFTDPDLLASYTAEYAPSRSLCYRSLFEDRLTLPNECYQSVLCLGSGAGSEFAALCASKSHIPMHICIQDLADYSKVLQPLENELIHTYPSLKDHLTTEHSVYDLLDLSCHSQFAIQVQKATLITAMFLLNELLTLSKANFVKLMHQLVKNMQKGAYLVVVESAGSFSEHQVGSNKYMCYSLLDPMSCFDIVDQYDSQWHRLDPQLQYPLKLNHMRHFLRVYKKIE
jgi:25S rRNA (uracil2843-N3)-methyltransferase